MHNYSYKRRTTPLLCLTVLAVVFCIQGCKKFLDEPQRSGLSLINTVEACMQILDYSLNNSNYPKDGLMSADDHYLSDADFDAFDEITRGLYSWDSLTAVYPTGADWLQSYKRIYNSNVVLESLFKIANETKGIENEANFKLVKGFAYFLRSYNFYHLLQLYAPPYAKGSAAFSPGIPLRLTSDFNYASERNSVEQCYTQIINDLEDAIALLPEQTIVPTRPNRSAAYGFLARVYQTMGAYDKALVAANNCLLSNDNANKLIEFTTLNKLSNTPFARYSREVLFHSTIAANPQKWKIDSLLYQSYEDQDLRKLIYFKQNTGTNAGTYYFTGNFEPSVSVLFSGIAIDEIFLIRAECYARANKSNEAMADLNKLLRSRWENTFTDFTAENATEALAIILKERRKELVLRNLRWTDLRRLNQDPAHAIIIKRLIHGLEYQLEPHDIRYTLLIPYDVIDNTNMSQNSR